MGPICGRQMAPSDKHFFAKLFRSHGARIEHEAGCNQQVVARSLDQMGPSRSNAAGQSPPGQIPADN